MNNLVNEKSPYLQLHASNPINWYPWGEEALKKAIEEDKPILLSIGYYSCHWCHVMNKEVFMDKSVAEILNRDFICIKVDREERPDIDSICMKYAVAIMGSGGWPLNLILTPDLKPFYAFTYLPRNNFINIMTRVIETWRLKRRDILRYSDELIRIVKETEEHSHPETIIDSHGATNRVYSSLINNYDEIYGGFGIRPKFPVYHNIIFLMRYWHLFGDERSIGAALTTLLKIRFSSLYDHIGGGVHRYAVNRNWTPPHFEKMLYDQAWLIESMLNAYKITKEELFKRTIEHTYNFLMREMYDRQKGFYSSLNAESYDGEEGRLYLWRINEIRDAVEDEKLLVELYKFGKGNYIDEFGEKHDRIIFHIDTKGLSYEELLRFYHESYKAIEEKDIPKLLEYRIENKGIMPYDKKILVDWNSMIISALAKSSTTLNNDEMLRTSIKTYSYLMDKRVKEGYLGHSIIDDEITSKAILDDYSYLIRASIDLYMATLNPKYIDYSIELTDEALALFYNQDKGKLYLNEGGKLGRFAEESDGAYPSGVSILIENLLRLHELTNIDNYIDIASKLVKNILTKAIEYPHYYVNTISATMLWKRWIDIVIAPGLETDTTNKFIKRISQEYLPNIIIIVKDKAYKNLPEYAKYIERKKETLYYICKDKVCLEPINNVEEAYKTIITNEY